ncbi:MAG: DUF6062 family protein [Treponema sp.]|jgi:hypothetical protein|nr:DUF6062 family protein [Treponema sp.]
MAIEKHINFFELQKASEKGGCPLCRIVSNRANRYIDNTLFEHISDRGFRALYRTAGGFCSFHSRHLVSFRDGLAVAILSRDILQDRIESFEKRSFWRPKGRCPVCVEREKIEQEYLDFLGRSDGNSIEERELREFFVSSDGLCAPHYAGLLFLPSGKKRTVPAWIKNFQEKKFKELKRRLDQFIDLSAYGRQKEFAALNEKDQLVWKEAAACLNEDIDPSA